MLISTNPNGRYQPGSMSLEWVVGENQPGERSCKARRQCLGVDERVADVIILKGHIITTFFEVKNAPKGGVAQNKEQMAGLLQKGQRAIIGVVYSTTRSPENKPICG